MTRRTEGPKRNAEAYAQHNAPEAEVSIVGMTRAEIKAALRDAWMAGYRAAARARRIDRPKPRKPGEPMRTPPTPATRSG